MLESFLQGFLLGIGAAIPLGPINILIINNALKSYKAGVALGFGAMSADIFYLLLTFTGMIRFIESQYLINIIGILGSAFLFYLAYTIYKDRLKTLKTNNKEIKGLLKVYFQGLILTLLNPMTIIFWLSIAGYSANKNLDITFTLFGLISAIMLWITIMPYLIHRSKHKISSRISGYLNTSSAIILLGFAISLFIDIVFF